MVLGRPQVIPKTTLARLPVYLRILLRELLGEALSVSSDRLALLAGLNAATVRRDLTYLGSVGVRGVGYDLRGLVEKITSTLGLDQRFSVVMVGAGNIGRALARYPGFDERGFTIVALFDTDPEKVGERAGGLVIEDVRDLESVVRDSDATMAVVAVPQHVTREVVERLIDAGVTAILSFEPVEMPIPTGVTLRTVDLADELQILTCMNRLKS